MRRHIVVLTGMSVNTPSLGRNIEKGHYNVRDGVKWDNSSQKLLVTNELHSVIGFGEQILREFGVKMVEHWIERGRWHLHGLPGTESVSLSPSTNTSRMLAW
jgi:hypothetical protein